MKKVTLYLTSICLFLTTQSFADFGATYYVSPSGNDSNPGSESSPFATIEGARDAIRALKSGSGLPVGGVRVLIEGGLYEVTSSIILDAQDTGESGKPIVYEGIDGDTVRLNGGKILQSSWVQTVTDTNILNAIIDPTARAGLKQVDLFANGINNLGPISRYGFGPATADSVVNRTPPTVLYIDGERQTLSRWPNSSDVHFDQIIDAGPTAADDDCTNRGGTFSYNYSENRPALWTRSITSGVPNDVWLQGVFGKSWENSYNKAAFIDTTAKEVTLRYGEQSGILVEWSPDHHYYQNVIEEIDMVGEYYIDRTSGILYFYPPTSYSELAITLLDEPILIINECNNITVKNIYFEYGRSYGIGISKSEDVVVENCDIAHFSEQGIKFTPTSTTVPTIFKKAWTIDHGLPVSSRLRDHEGTESYVPTSDQDQIYHQLSSATSETLTVYFYDFAPRTDGAVEASAYNSSTGKSVRIGLNDSVSSTHYTYDLGDGVYTQSSVLRTTGWRKFEWIFGTECKLYIDGTLIGTSNQMTQFDRIYMGDNQSDGKIADYVGFDTVSVGTTFSNGIETSSTVNHAPNTPGRRCGIKNSHIYDVGAHGVVLNGGDQLNLVPGENFVINCEIHKFAQYNPGWKPGVYTQNIGNIIRNNKIHDAPHVGLVINGNDHIIEYNEVYDVANQLPDIGALYMNEGREPHNSGTLIRRNYFHDFALDQSATHGLYMDNQTMGVTLEENIFYNIGSKSSNFGINFNSSSYCTARHNIFVDVSGAVRMSDHSLTNHNYVSQWNDIFDFFNDFVATPYELAYPYLMTFWDDWNNNTGLPRSTVMDRNLLFDGGATSLKVPGGIVDEFSSDPMTVTGNYETTSDPGFADYANQDFNLVAGGAVFTQIPGFPDIPFDQIGLTGPVGPNVDSSAAVLDSFDAESTGSDPANYIVNESGGSAEIAGIPSATDKSLKLEDTSTSSNVKVEKTFDPLSGPLVWMFDVRAEQTKELYISMLSSTGSYALQIRTTNSGKIGYKEGGSYYDSTTTYSTGTFHTISLYIDTDTDTYSVYMDGAHVISDKPMLSSVSNVSKIMYGTSGGNTGTFYLDDIMVVENPLIVDDKFDKEATGSNPEYYTSTETGGTVNIAEVPSATDKSIEMDDTSTSSPTKIESVFEAATGPNVVWEFDLRPEQNNTIYMTLLSSTGEYVLQLRTTTSGLIGYKESGTYYDTTTSYSTGSFQTLRVEVDENAKTYSVLLDGTSVLTAKPFLNSNANDVAEMTFSTGGGATGKYYIDNIRVSY